MGWYIINMEMLISVTDEPGKKRLIEHFDNPYMPKAVYNPYFLMEIIEKDPDILERIRKLLPLIEKEFSVGDEYLFESTSNGFKIKKKINKGVYDQGSWDKWNDFSRGLYEEIAQAIELENNYE